MLRYDHPSSLGAVLLALPWIFLGCGKNSGTTPPNFENRPPVLSRFEVVEDRVHVAQEVTVLAAATDPDRDRLEYFWSVDRGSLPFGRSGIIAKWLTPDSAGIATVTVRVTDREDTIYGRLPVTLVRVFPPDSAWTTNYPSIADVSWTKSPDEGILHWVGYDVYMAEQSLAGLSEEEVEPYRITSQPVLSRTKRAISLVVGRRYYFHVRSVRQYSGKTERSLFAYETEMSPRPGGDISGLIEFGGDNATVFDISDGVVRPLDPNDPSDLARSDIYVEADPSDPTEQIVLRSVSHLAPFDPAWGERVVELKSLGLDYSVSSTDPEVGWVTTLRVARLEVFAVRTPEGNYGKAQVTDIRRFPPDRNVWLSWAYQTIPNYVSF